MTKAHETRVVSKGQALLESVAAWILSYMTLKNPDDAKVLALWAIGTHKFWHVYSYPYLILTKGQPGCGATVLMELIGRLSLNHWTVTAADAALWRKLELAGMPDVDPSISQTTICYDEAEVLKSKVGTSVMQFWNVGYRRGAIVPKVTGRVVTDYPAFCPKVATMIGSSAATLVDRSLIQVLYRMPAPKLYRPELADREGEQLQRDIADFWKASDCSTLHAVEFDGLTARDLEIWSSLYGIASFLHLDDATLKIIRRLAKDNCEWKRGGENLRRLVTNRADDSAEYAVRALADLLAVIGSEPTIHTDTAIAKMREIDDAPWRVYDGDGLTPIALGKLLADAGVNRSAATVKIKGKVAAGYKLADLKAAITR